MDKVVCSTITRTYNKRNDELYSLLEVIPATPVNYVHSVDVNNCNFQPRNDKHYIPIRKNRVRVKTVRDIRNQFEKDVLSELPAELEKQQNYILRKIKGGFLRENKTQSHARNMIKCNKPLTKASWQMLMNMNPEGQAHSMQYVMWNGKRIRVNGSKGGRRKFICNYDLEKNKKPLKNNSLLKRNVYNRKKGLLHSSLSVNFKPGPLSRKMCLDKSYQKYHVGQIELTDLPKPGLNIQPMHGNALDPTIANFVNKLRKDDGMITQQWAEFAVSVLGTVNGTNVCQNASDGFITFNLNFKHNQTRLLTRRDLQCQDDSKQYDNHSLLPASQTRNESEVLPEVKDIINGLLNAVDININQDSMYTEDDEIRKENHPDQVQNNCKEKPKRKFCELDRLNVTVITLPENESAGNQKLCQNSFCALGCICGSLKSTITLKGHCGRIDCMFKCKCDFSRYIVTEASDSDCKDLLPSLFNLNEKINFNLSKEEQKFRQTVVVAGDRSILLKSKKRNSKSSKNYEDFHCNLPLKSNSKIDPVLTIVLPKLDCDNIEPWCMVHNLYKCFCKGIFTETGFREEIINDLNKNVNDGNETVKELATADVYEIQDEDSDCYYEPLTRKSKYNMFETDSCARVNPYEGRKYSSGYYRNAYIKLREMEVNDSTLRKRLLLLMNKSVSFTENVATNNEDNSEGRDKSKHDGENKTETEGTEETENNYKEDTKHESEHETLHEDKEESKISEIQTDPETDTSVLSSKTTPIKMVEGSTDKRFGNKPKLVVWLETSYKHYKRRLDMGILKNNLEPPKKGKVALYPWDFILRRYSEKKNLFLVSKIGPHRIFMAVNPNNPLFENCININDIRFADLNKYPTTVKNLLTNTNDMKDYFCILYGYKVCWELIGTVTKIDTIQNKQASNTIPRTISTEEDSQSNHSDSQSNHSDSQSNHSDSQKIFVNYDTETSIEFSSAIPQISPYSKESPKQSESSKWFIMTVEKDFSEIQFYNRGFFVKHESIVRAINVARQSGKTVRLSSQQCANKGNSTQFGIYAIPNANEYCVFIGPYETNENLGVETIKTIPRGARKHKRTRGVWITTDKVDNMKVIDNPLSFMPSQEIKHKNVIPVGSVNDSETTVSINTENETEKSKLVSHSDPSSKIISKTVKPIKIGKTNSVFQLSSNSILKKVSSFKPANQPIPILPATVIINPTSGMTTLPVISNISSSVLSLIENKAATATDVPLLLPISRVTGLPGINIPKRPVAEVAPQIKISAVYSECFSEKTSDRTKKEGGMFILKPQEINEKIETVGSDKNPEPGSSKSENDEHKDDDMAMDIENFLDTSKICTASENETFIISDDEEAPIIEETKKVFIGCTNIKNFGAISGQIDTQNRISFQFPGFKSSEFYEKDEVFDKINQVISRKVYIPKNLTLEWRIVEAITDLRCPRLLEKEEFALDLMMTPKGMQKKIVVAKRSDVKAYMNKNKKTGQKIILNSMFLGSEGNSSVQFENRSQSLDDENPELLTVVNKSELLECISNASDIDRELFTNILKDIENMAQTIDD